MCYLLQYYIQTSTIIFTCLRYDNKNANVRNTLKPDDASISIKFFIK